MTASKEKQQEIANKINEIEKAKDANKVKDKKELIELINATVSSELRNPLSSLIGLIDQLKTLIDELKSKLSDDKCSELIFKIGKMQL